MIGPIIQALGWTLLHSLWQLALVGVAAALLMQVWRSPQAQYRLGCAALLACALLPLATFFSHVGAPASLPTVSPAGVTMASDLASTSALEPGALPWTVRAQTLLASHLPLLALAWSLGVGIMATRLAGGWLETRRWRREAQPVPPRLERAFRDLALRMGASTRTLLRASAHLTTPVALGLWRPVVLVPLSLLTHLPEETVEALLAHELAHVRRHDYLVNLLQSLLEVFCFHHPTVWWLSRRIRTVREHLADDLAARTLGDAQRLALALDALDDLHRLQVSPPLTPTLALAARGGTLLPRIQRLLTPTPVSRPAWAPGLLAALLLPCAAFALCAATADAPPIPVPRDLLAQVDALAAKEGIDPHLLRALAWTESGFNPKALSPRGARGLLQVMPETAKTLGAKDLEDPIQVMAAGAHHLKTLLDRYPGDVAKAVAAYNGGVEAIDAGRPSQETQAYVPMVMGLYQAKAVAPESPLVEGEVQGVIRSLGDGADGQLEVSCRISHRSDLEFQIDPLEEPKKRGTLLTGTKNADGSRSLGETWSESRPRLRVLAPRPGTPVLIRCADLGIGWKGETRVVLNGPVQTFRFRMSAPQAGK